MCDGSGTYYVHLVVISTRSCFKSTPVLFVWFGPFEALNYGVLGHIQGTWGILPWACRIAVRRQKSIGFFIHKKSLGFLKWDPAKYGGARFLDFYYDFLETFRQGVLVGAVIFSCTATNWEMAPIEKCCPNYDSWNFISIMCGAIYNVIKFDAHTRMHRHLSDPNVISKLPRDKSILESP